MLLHTVHALQNIAKIIKVGFRKVGKRNCLFLDEMERAVACSLFALIKSYSQASLMDESRIFIIGKEVTTLASAIAEVNKNKFTHPCILMEYAYPAYNYYIYIDSCTFKVSSPTAFYAINL